MTILAQIIDAAVGVDTHRDTHEAEITSPTGAVLATTQVPNTSAGFIRLLDWITEHAPGPNVVVAVEGTRSYGIGLTRSLTAAGLTVLECEQPTTTARRGKGKTDAIDAHLAALFVLRQDDRHLPTHAPTAHEKDCEYCCRPGPNSPRPPPRKPTGYVRCCSPATTRIVTPPAAPSPTRPWRGSRVAGAQPRPTHTSESATVSSAGSPSPCAKPPGR